MNLITNDWVNPLKSTDNTYSIAKNILHRGQSNNLCNIQVDVFLKIPCQEIFV